jgi:hypothetical protein
MFPMKYELIFIKQKHYVSHEVRTDIYKAEALCFP